MTPNALQFKNGAGSSEEYRQPTTATAARSPREQLLAYAEHADAHHIEALLSIKQTHLGDFRR